MGMEGYLAPGSGGRALRIQTGQVEGGRVAIRANGASDGRIDRAAAATAHQDNRHRQHDELWKRVRHFLSWTFFFEIFWNFLLSFRN